jgi:diaminopimelate decarboxylase
LRLLFFLFSQNILETQYQTIKQGLDRYWPNNKIYYSAKTNFEEAVLKILLDLGSQLEIACGHELYIAKKVGFKAQKICFDGAVKTAPDLEYALKAGPMVFNMDSLDEAEVLNNLAKRLNKKAQVGFRINPEIQGFLKGPAIIYIRKFGIPLSQARLFYNKLARYKNLEPVTISAHIGSQVTSIKPYQILIKRLIKLAQELEQDGIIIKEINLGGGFPSASLKKLGPIKFALSQARLNFNPKVPPLSQYALTIARDFARQAPVLKNKPVLAVEPGRSLASPMGILIARVAVIKGNWIFLDASKYAISESIFFSQNEIIPVAKLAYPKTHFYHIAGSSLNTGDIIALNKKLPQMEKGDPVAILDAGAYSVSRAVQFTVLDPPVFLIASNKKLRLIRRQGQYQDLTLKTVSK